MQKTGDAAVPRLYTIPDVEEITRRKRRSLYTDIALGKLRVTRLSKRCVRIHEDDLREYIERGRGPARGR